MENTIQEESADSTPGVVASIGDPAARTAGALLVLTAAATIVAVITRVSAGADQPTLAESLVAVAESRGLYAAGGAARLVSAITLIAAAWFLSRTWIIREGWGSSLVPVIFAASAALTAISGICSVSLAVAAPTGADPSTFEPATSTETLDLLRWLTGKVGFTLAGLALIVAARQQWKGGGMLRRMSPVSGLIGLAMLFIWIDSATFMHPINGSAFVLWLFLIGGMLLSGRVECHFEALREPHD